VNIDVDDALPTSDWQQLINHLTGTAHFGRSRSAQVGQVHMVTTSADACPDASHQRSALAPANDTEVTLWLLSAGVPTALAVMSPKSKRAPCTPTCVSAFVKRGALPPLYGNGSVDLASVIGRLADLGLQPHWLRCVTGAERQASQESAT